MKFILNLIPATNPMDAGSKQNNLEGWNSEQREVIFYSLLHKIVCKFDFLANSFKFICLLNKGFLKPVFIGFMFVFLQQSANVFGKLHHAFAQMKSSGQMNIRFPAGSFQKGFDLSIDVIN